MENKAITQSPDSFAEAITLPSGQRLHFRPLKHSDSALLAHYFLSLSAETRRRYAPHPFTAEQAERICAELDYDKIIPLVAVTDPPRIVGYIILRLLLGEGDQKRYHSHGLDFPPDSACSIAPSVADDYQGCGLGSRMITKTLALAARLGRKQAILQGGVQATNSRAVHVYEKCGFRHVASFSTTIDNHDMLADLA